MALTNKLSAIGDAIRGKTGKSELMTLDEMPDEIESISGGGEEVLYENTELVGGFSGKAIGKLFRVLGSSIKTENLTSLNTMFNNQNIQQSSGLTDLSMLELNIHPDYLENGYLNLNCASSFYACGYLEKLPKLMNNNIRLESMLQMFYYCSSLSFTEMNEYLNHFDWDLIHSRNVPIYGLFQNCYSIRNIPSTFLQKLYSSDTSQKYTTMFYGCRCLDGIDGLFPIPPETNATTNYFIQSFDNCSRLSKLKFATNNGVPYTRNWTNQSINLRSYVGYVNNTYKSDIYSWKSGITADKEVYDATTYQALKNDPDWFTTNINYSRYNHASAVETINSLPDTSAVSDPSAPSNKIYFKTGSGSLTDGGGVDALTAEEIAVATNKGWQVIIQ